MTAENGAAPEKNAAGAVLRIILGQGLTSFCGPIIYLDDSTRRTGPMSPNGRETAG